MEWCDQSGSFWTHGYSRCKNEHHFHIQKWRCPSLVMGVLCCCKKWKSWLYEGHHAFFKSIKPFFFYKDAGAFGAETKACDQWTILQDSHPKVYIQIYWSLVLVSRNIFLSGCTVFRFKSDWKYWVLSLNWKKAVITKEDLWSSSFFKWGMGQNYSGEVTEAFKHLHAAFIGV